MAIEFHCNHCQCELRVQEQDAGKKARCPRCGMIHQVPSSSFSQETVYLSDNPQPEETPLTEAPHAENSVDQNWSMKTPDGQVYGPVSRSELDQWAEEGRVSSQCLLQCNNESHWQSALVLFPHLAAATPTAAINTNANPRDVQREYATGARPVYHRAAYAVENRRPNNGVAVLVMGILGVCFMPMPIFGLIALFMGAGERSAIQRGEASSENRWMVDVGFVLGVVSSIIGCMIVFGCCFAFNGGF